MRPENKGPLRRSLAEEKPIRLVGSEVQRIGEAMLTTKVLGWTLLLSTTFALTKSGNYPKSADREKREGTMIGYTGTPKRYLHVEEETVVETVTGEPWDSHKTIMTLGKATDAPKRARRAPDAEEVVVRTANFDDNGDSLTRTVQSQRVAFSVPAGKFLLARRFRRQSSDAKQHAGGDVGTTEQGLIKMVRSALPVPRLINSPDTPSGRRRRRQTDAKQASYGDGKSLQLTVSKRLEVRTQPTGDYDDLIFVSATGAPTARFNQEKLPLHNPKDDAPKRTRRQADLNEKLITGTGKTEWWTFHSQRVPIRSLKKIDNAPKARARRDAIAPQFLLKEHVGTPQGEAKTPTHSISKQTFMAAKLREGSHRVARGVPVGSAKAESIIPESSIQRANWKINMQSQRVPVKKPASTKRVARGVPVGSSKAESIIPESSIQKANWKINMKSQRVPVKKPAGGSRRVRREGIPPQFLLKEKVGTPEGESKTPTYSISKQTFMAAKLREGSHRLARGVPVGSAKAEAIIPESSVQRANWKINMQSQRVPVKKPTSAKRVARQAVGRGDEKIPQSEVHKEAWKINLKSQRIPVKLAPKP